MSEYEEIEEEEEEEVEYEEIEEEEEVEYEEIEEEEEHEEEEKHEEEELTSIEGNISEGNPFAEVCRIQEGQGETLSQKQRIPHEKARVEGNNIKEGVVTVESQQEIYTNRQTELEGKFNDESSTKKEIAFEIEPDKGVNHGKDSVTLFPQTHQKKTTNNDSTISSLTKEINPFKDSNVLSQTPVNENTLSFEQTPMTGDNSVMEEKKETEANCQRKPDPVADMKNQEVDGAEINIEQNINNPHDSQADITAKSEGNPPSDINPKCKLEGDNSEYLIELTIPQESVEYEDSGKQPIDCTEKNESLDSSAPIMNNLDPVISQALPLDPKDQTLGNSDEMIGLSLPPTAKYVKELPQSQVQAPEKQADKNPPQKRVEPSKPRYPTLSIVPKYYGYINLQERDVVGVLASPTSYYSGGFSNNKKENFGVAHVIGSFKYEGEYHLGKRHGVGKLRRRKMTYIGDFIEGKSSGIGELYSTNNRLEVKGQFNNGKLAGLGETYFQQDSKGIWMGDCWGKRILGTFDSEQVSGTVEAKSDSGKIYWGSVDNGFYQGFGIEKTTEETSSLGFWNESALHGDGEIQGKYIGQFKQGHFNGYGYLTTPNSVYIGEFDENLKCGFGRQTYNNGDLYMGGWLEGKRHGLGFRIQNGIPTLGFWKNGVPCGNSLRVESKNIDWRVIHHETTGKECSISIRRTAPADQYQIYTYDSSGEKVAEPSLSIELLTEAKKVLELSVTEIEPNGFFEAAKIRLNYIQSILVEIQKNLASKTKEILSDISNKKKSHSNQMKALRNRYENMLPKKSEISNKLTSSLPLKLLEKIKQMYDEPGVTYVSASKLPAEYQIVDGIVKAPEKKIVEQIVQKMEDSDRDETKPRLTWRESLKRNTGSYMELIGLKNNKQTRSPSPLKNAKTLSMTEIG